jgi:hypothetical protein
MLHLGQLINITLKMINFFLLKKVNKLNTGLVIDQILKDLVKVNFMTKKS